MTASFKISETWDPYVRVPGAYRLVGTDSVSDEFRALLVDRAIRQVEAIIDTVDRDATEALPPILRSLDQETSGLMTNRVLNMLVALEAFMRADEHADVRERLSATFQPMSIWVEGQYAITSPALLVVQSILYSHCEWFREFLWEAHSAQRAYVELESRGFPEGHCRFIEAIIAHQTLLRAAWITDITDPKEVQAFYKREGRLTWAESEFEDEEHTANWIDEMASRAIARTLFPFVQQSKQRNLESKELQTMERQLAAALVLHSLCLYCRHQWSRPTNMTAIKRQGFQYLDHLLYSRTPSNPQYKPYLIYLKYGRYIDAANRELHSPLTIDPFEKTKKYIFSQLDPDDMQNVSFCFQRVSSKRIWKEHEFKKGEVKKLEVGKLEERISDPLVRKTVGKVFLYRLKPEYYVQRTLGF